MKVYLKTRKNFVSGIYENGKITILKGCVIDEKFSSNFSGSKKVLAARSDSAIVGKDFKLKQDVSFNSPSTAAQFVKGYSTNGWKAWKDEAGNYIEIYKEKDNGQA